MTSGPTFSPELYEKVAREYGTPTHVLDMRRLKANISSMHATFARHSLAFRILYSVKTNYLPIVLQTFKNSGSGVDVVSGPELQLAIKLSFLPNDITFNGPYKTDDELSLAVRGGIFINVDSFQEAERINRIAKAEQQIVDIGLRVNPGEAVYVSNDPTFNLAAQRSATQSKFGLSIGDGCAREAVDHISQLDRVKITGVHSHLGSQITDASAFGCALDSVIRFTKDLCEHCRISRLNIGGGFGVPGIRRERSGALWNLLAIHGATIPLEQKPALDFDSFLTHISSQLKLHDLTRLDLYCEPGRALISDAMALLTRVAGTKRTGGVDWIILDAGLNHMPTIAMNEDHHMHLLTGKAAPSKPFRVGGPLCYDGDVLSAQKLFPSSIEAGQLLLIQDSGAYTVSRSTNFIRPRAAVVAVDGPTIELCWRREVFEDIFCYHVPTSALPGPLVGHASAILHPEKAIV